VPPRVKETFEYLKSIAPSSLEEREHEQVSKPIDPTIFFGYISAKGLFFSDVLGGAPGQVGLEQLRKALKSQRGLIYRYIVGLAVDVAGYLDYSKAPFQVHSGIVRVSLASYDLTFANEGSSLRLQRIESTDPGGD
jgi:hypothetical protein